MGDYTPTPNEVRADFALLHTRNFDEYQVGRSLTSEQEFYGDIFDRVLAKVRAEAWDQGWVSAMQYEGRCQDAEAAGQGVFITEPKNPYRTTESED